MWEDLKALAAWFPGIDGSGDSGSGIGPSGDLMPNATRLGGRPHPGIPQSEAMHVTERFIPVDENTLLYRVTVEDPNAFERPWTVEIPMNRSPDYRILEYTCHEGNYGLENTLRAGRAEDAAAGR